MSRTADQDEYVVLYDVPPGMYAKLLDAIGNVRARHSYSDRTLEIRRVLHGIGPDQYREILEALGDHSLRHTYDGWDLEMMSPRQEHEWIKRLIGRMVEGHVNSQSIPIKSISSTTLRAPGYAQGVQPDECYFVQNELAVRGNDGYDPVTDPPPDLVIEVEREPSRWTVVVQDDTGADVIAIRSMVYLALTYDHRLVDGADAARFLSAIKTRLEDAAFEAELGA